MGATTYNVSTSGELMENYIQSDILLPQDKFLALQTNAGASLLFSIGTGGVFNLTVESPGQTHGWRLNDLSTAQIKREFPSGATCTDFAAAQAVSIQPGGSAQIHLAMVLNDGANDHLYISLSNSDSDLSWISAPVWTPCPYNAVDATGAPVAAPSPVKVAGVFLCEATDNEYIVVDLIRNPTESAGVLQRFYLDVTDPATPQWTPHDVAGDISATGYQSSLGRTARAYGMDGIYTSGIIGSGPQLMYTPLAGSDPTQPPAPSRLNLPDGLAADSIAASRNADNSSDLYVAAKGALYYFASTNQHDRAVGELLLSNTLLTQVNKLYAYPADGNITVGGLNASNQVFYLTCPQNELTDASAWNLPMVIATGVDAISPYIDRSWSANTFFAHGPNGLVKLVKTPGTSLWSEKDITLPPSDLKQDPLVVSSYTTHIQVNDSNGNAAPNVTVSLTATSVTTVYINHLYYIIGSTPIEVTTDNTGTITIVETVKTLGGSRYTAVVDSQPVPQINPMDSAFQRNSAYDSKEKLQAATIVDRQGNTTKLIPPGTTDADLDGVATSNQNIAKAYAGKVSSMPPARVAAVRMSAAKTVPQALVDAGYAEGILADIGDLFRTIENAVEAVVNFIEDVANEIWHIVVTIGDAIYHAVLDCVEHIVAAVLWLYNAIKTVIDDVIKFLEFLFGWQDIIVTHNVLRNLFIVTAQSAVDGIGDIKQKAITSFQSLESNINAWAGIPNFDQTPGGTSASNAPPDGLNSAPSNLGVHHFKGNASNMSGTLAPNNPVESLLTDLGNMVTNETTTVSNAFSAIRTDIITPFPTLTTTQIIEKLVAIIGDTVIQSAENAVSTILDLAATICVDVTGVLTAPLDIPVLSWLYKDITGNDLSILDLLCLVAAIPVTLVYKIAANVTPFPQGDPLTVGILNAKTLTDLAPLFFSSKPSAKGSEMLGDAPVILNDINMKMFMFVTGICAAIGAVLLVVVSVIQRFALGWLFPKLLATVAALANLAYLSPDIPTMINALSGDWAADLNNVVTSVSIVKSIAAIFVAEVETDTAKQVVLYGFAIVESLINLAWNAPVIDNIIVNQAYFLTSYKSLIVESIANFSFNLGGMLEIFVALNSENPDALTALSAVQFVCMGVYGVGIAIAGGIYKFMPYQSHDVPPPPYPGKTLALA
jgi:hypothetical protein